MLLNNPPTPAPLADGVWFPPFSENGYQQFTFFRYLFYFSTFFNFWNPVSACILISPSMLSYVSLFPDGRILKPRPISFHAAESGRFESSQMMTGIKVWVCWGFNILWEEPFAWPTPSLDAKLNTQWCGSIWTIVFCMGCSFYVWTNIEVCCCNLLCCLRVLEPRYFCCMDPVLQW